MYYDYRTYLNTIIQLLQTINDNLLKVIFALVFFYLVYVFFSARKVVYLKR